MKREHCYLSVHFVVVASLLACGLGLPVQAQTFSVLHTFSGLLDGAHPAGLTIDRTGNFYGASEGEGVVRKEPFSNWQTGTLHGL
jgi:hypothetical protein